MTVKLVDMNPLTDADISVELEGVPGLFSEFSGIQFDVTRPTYSDGETNVRRKAGSGTVEYSDVTLKRPFDPESERDIALIAWAEAAKCSVNSSDITARPVRRCNGGGLQRGRQAWYLSGCRLKTFKTFEGNTAGGDNTMMIEIALTVEQATWR